MSEINQYLYRIQPARPEMLTGGPTPEEERATSLHFSYLQELLAAGAEYLLDGTEADERRGHDGSLHPRIADHGQAFEAEHEGVEGDADQGDEQHRHEHGRRVEGNLHLHDQVTEPFLGLDEFADDRDYGRLDGPHADGLTHRSAPPLAAVHAIESGRQRKHNRKSSERPP